MITSGSKADISRDEWQMSIKRNKHDQYSTILRHRDLCHAEIACLNSRDLKSWHTVIIDKELYNQCFSNLFVMPSMFIKRALFPFTTLFFAGPKFEASRTWTRTAFNCPTSCYFYTMYCHRNQPLSINHCASFQSESVSTQSSTCSISDHEHLKTPSRKEAVLRKQNKEFFKTAGKSHDIFGPSKGGRLRYIWSPKRQSSRFGRVRPRKEQNRNQQLQWNLTRGGLRLGRQKYEPFESGRQRDELGCWEDAPTRILTRFSDLAMTRTKPVRARLLQIQSRRMSSIRTSGVQTPIQTGPSPSQRRRSQTRGTKTVLSAGGWAG